MVLGVISEWVRMRGARRGQALRNGATLDGNVRRAVRYWRGIEELEPRMLLSGAWHVMRLVGAIHHTTSSGTSGCPR